jgi:hypothetical protein
MKVMMIMIKTISMPQLKTTLHIDAATNKVKDDDNNYDFKNNDMMIR